MQVDTRNGERLRGHQYTKAVNRHAGYERILTSHHSSN